MLPNTLWRDMEQSCFLLSWGRFSTGVLTTGNKEQEQQEPGPTPPAMPTKALQQKAPQPYLIYLPGHDGEISLW